MINSIEGKYAEAFVHYLVTEKLQLSSELCYSNIEMKGTTLFNDLEDIDFSLGSLDKELNVFYYCDLGITNPPVAQWRAKANEFYYKLSHTRHTSTNFYFITKSLDNLDKRLRRMIDYRYTVLIFNKQLYYRCVEVIPIESQIEAGDTPFGNLVVNTDG